VSRQSTEELARKLLAAARAERPSEALGKRLQLLDPARQYGQASPGAAPARVRGRKAIAPRRIPWLVAACVAGIAGLGINVVWHSTPRAPQISAERVPTASSGEARVEPEHVIAPPPSPMAVAPSVPRSVQTRRPTSTSMKTPALTSPQTLAAPAPASGTLAGEIALLTQARAALRAGAGASALELLDQYAETRAGTALDLEATLLRIEALSATRQHARAAALAQRFVADHPNSALTDRAKSFIPKARAKHDPSKAPVAPAPQDGP
jgi:hypothetical protein